MSTINDPRVEPSSSAPGSEADPFRYGWRYIPRKQPDGRVELDQVPLTLEDLLFPEEGDFAVQYPSHVNDCFTLKMVFDAKLRGDPEAVVLTDCRIDWNLPGVRPLGPDVAVFLGVPRDFDRGTLSVAEVGARPVLVVEVTSPDTRKNDFGIKKDFYHRAGVPLYVIVDARPGPTGRRVKLLGFRHSPEGYDPLPLDGRDRLLLEPLGVWLAIFDGRVICIDGETGQPIGDYGEQVQARIEAEARTAEAEATALDEAFTRMKFQAIAEVATRTRIAVEARADALSQIADEAQARANALSRIADEAQARANAEARTREAETQIRILAEARAEAAETRMREMEAELRRSRGEG